MQKIQSMGLYLPRENAANGQLEFKPAILHPDPSTERVFIARESNSGVAASLPQALTKLPGFETATALLPGYPMISSDEASPVVGTVEEVMCDPNSKNRAAALSVPLLSGPQTVGVLLVSPSESSFDGPFWTDQDREQISIAAQSLSIALSMDNERLYLHQQNKNFRESLSNSLHQVKNPLQALRTYGKLLERRISTDDDMSGSGPLFPTNRGSRNLMDLTNSVMAQSDRIADLLLPIDALVEQMDYSTFTPYLLGPSKQEPVDTSLVVWQAQDAAAMNGTIDHESSDGVHKTQVFNSTTIADDQPRSSDMLPSNPSNRALIDHPQPTSSSSIQIFGDDEIEMAFVTDLLESTLTSFYTMCREQGVQFSVIEEDDELPGVAVSPKALQEALTNLLDNALKYVKLPKADSPFQSNPSPKIMVRFLSNDEEEHGGRGVTILVEDNGPGIAEHERSLIFDRGYRSPSTTSIKGTGIGLDIAKNIIARMGGVLTAENPGFARSSSLDGAIMKIVLFRRQR